MAKILGPLHSISAAGSFGPRLTFSNRKSGQQVRIQKAQVYTPNTAQQTAREAYAAAYAGWNALSDEEKQEYKDRAGAGMTGYNLYMKENISTTPTETLELDYFEYSSNSLIRAAYINSKSDCSLIPIMTNNTEPSGVASAQSVIAEGYEAFRAMNGITTGEDGWFSENTVPQFLKYQFAYAQIVTGYSLTAPDSGNYNYMARDWDFQGSNDNSNWTTLDSQADISFTQKQTRNFTFSNTTAYIYYRLNVTDNNYTNKRVIINEIQLFTDSIFSESTIKTQGTYSGKIYFPYSISLNSTVKKTLSSTIDLSDRTTLKIDVRTSRTGTNLKIGIKNSGGTTSEKTIDISQADTWETKTWDISSISNADKNAISEIILTCTNANENNTIFIDNFYSE
jgi:hypothetical protein